MSDKVKWLVQKEGFAMANHTEAIEVLERFGFNYDSFGLMPPWTKVLNLAQNLSDPESKYIVRGGTRLYAILNAVESLIELDEHLVSEQMEHGPLYLQRLRQGIFYDEQRFDQAYYAGLGLPLLNGDATMYPIASNLARSFEREMFVKPSKDEKAFDAGILAPGQTIEAFISSQAQARDWIDEMAVIAPCKAITAEYRFFVVDRQVVTGSLYRFAGKPNFNASIPANLKRAANEFAQMYQPHSVFTMDLAETPEGIRIVEYNCRNASRMYAADVAKIFHAVHDFVVEKT